MGNVRSPQLKRPDPRIVWACCAEKECRRTRHDTGLEGYRTNLKEQVERAPKYSASTGWNWNRENDRRVRLLPNQTLLGRGMNRG